MGAGLHIAEVANLVGDPARANILAALLDQRALTASRSAQPPGLRFRSIKSMCTRTARSHQCGAPTPPAVRNPAAASAA
jgi:hypothetical protein